jgi:hypothetical protein
MELVSYLVTIAEPESSTPLELIPPLDMILNQFYPAIILLPISGNANNPSP